MSKFFFNKQKYTLLFELEEGALHLPQEVLFFASQNNFKKKDEFHITLIGNGEAQKLKKYFDGLEEVERDKQINLLEKNILECSVNFSERNVFYSLSQKEGDKKESVIGLVDFFGFSKIKEVIKKNTGCDISAPFFHVTFFTKNDNQNIGIGIKTRQDFLSLSPKIIFAKKDDSREIKNIFLPGRMQIDVAVALFFLTKFGTEKFINIKDANFKIVPILGESDAINRENILLDVGGGDFDHHNKEMQITCSELVLRNLNLDANPAVNKLLSFAERDDFFGKGTLSQDPIDKAFGLTGLLLSLNRQFENDPKLVFEKVLPLLEAHYADEEVQTILLPNQIKKMEEEGALESFFVRQKGHDIKVTVGESDNSTMASFLRGAQGGGSDVVVLWRKSGHVNIVTRQFKNIDLRSLVALVRRSEMILSDNVAHDMEYLSQAGRIKEVPKWYYDISTNTLQNGGINPLQIEPTKISKQSMIELVKLGLSETLWKPSR